jgi:hypothetical protein
LNFLPDTDPAKPNQMIVLDNGFLVNRALQKSFSANAANVKADLNDTRGAGTWKIGQKNLVFVNYLALLKRCYILLSRSKLPTVKMSTS